MHHNIKIFLLSLIACATIFSCTEPIDVNLPESNKKIVIEGFIENGKVAMVSITRSVPLFSSVSNISPEDFLVLDAIVSVSDGSTTEILPLTIDSSNSLPLVVEGLSLVYKGKLILGAPGQTYFLEVTTADGKVYSASTTIPQPVALDSIWWMSQPPNDTLGFANAHLTDPSGLGNNYKWFAKRPTKDRRYIAPIGSVFDDKLINGKSFDFAYNKGYDPTDEVNSFANDPDSEKNFYRKSDTICIKFCSIDRASKDFYATFESAISNNGNPFSSPTTILGNINNGALGAWIGLGATYDTIMPTP